VDAVHTKGDSKSPKIPRKNPPKSFKEFPTFVKPKPSVEETLLLKILSPNLSLCCKPRIFGNPLVKGITLVETRVSQIKVAST